MRWLGLDVGAERVGIAMSDPIEVAFIRLPALAFRGPAALAVQVADLCRERGVEAVVVGVPRTASGVGRGGARIGAVLEALRAQLQVPVAEEDEAGSTREAEHRLAAEGVPRGRWPRLVDSVAAEVILQRHLARRGRAAGEPMPVDQVEHR
ncbi:MAG TPA: Holliday junction resolvase RuvX [Thermoanaerobaculaceae bacterium]|nr:Holliday junction resolvase RuvX [Thermoanaerobaculaceae bacterium]HRS16358.1 Holliday junction resolvase RuvX [Thermoanaerobaculaceae bacterium]